MNRILNNKDYYGGALMVLVGLSAIYGGMDYKIGSLSHMGPGFFPAALGSLLTVTGLLIAISARSTASAELSSDAVPVAEAHPHGLPDLRGGICILLSILAFLLFGVYGGLLPASFAIVFIAALGDRNNTLKQAFFLSIAMAVIAYVVFWWALQLQLPLFRWG